MATEPTTVQAETTDEVLQASPEEIAAFNAVMDKLEAAAQETVRLLDSIHTSLQSAIAHAEAAHGRVYSPLRSSLPYALYFW
jgi:hypothetical protein